SFDWKCLGIADSGNTRLLISVVTSGTLIPRVLFQPAAGPVPAVEPPRRCRKQRGVRILEPSRRAEVAELADALRSGRSGSTPVGVRVPPSAPAAGRPALGRCLLRGAAR